MTRFAAAWNQPGYMPNPDDVYVTDTFADAVRYVNDQIEHWWDGDYMDTDGHIDVDVDARYMEAHTALHNAPTAPWRGHVYDDAGEVAYVFWIDKSEGGDE